MKTNLFKVLVSVLSGALIFAGAKGMPLNAQTSLDPNETGSITVTLEDTSGTPVCDSEITMYRVAYVSSDATTYYFVKDFSYCDENINDLTSNSLADSLYEYVCDNNIDGITGTTDDSGKIVYDNLPVGIYLFAQDEAAEGYDKMLPFIVTLPIYEDEYIYTVDAAPKMEPLEKDTTDEPTPTPTTPVTPTPSDTDEPTPTPTEPPKPTGSSGSGTTDGPEGGGDGSSNTNTSTNTTGSGSDSDSNSHIKNPSPTPSPNGGTSTTTTTTTTTDIPEKLPQTGQLNWPIPVCVLSGTFFIIIGCILVRRKEN